MEVYMSPGSVTEMLYFFIAGYTHDMKLSEGGGHCTGTGRNRSAGNTI